MFDANGNVVGIPWYMPDTSHASRIFVENIDRSMTQHTLEGTVEARAGLFFELSDCQGQAYVEGAEVKFWANHLTGPYPDPLPKFFAVDKTGVVPTVSVLSQISPFDFTCMNRDHPLNTSPAIAAFAFTGTLPFPFPPATPFYVGLPPEANP
jgi:hypothetical protein